MQGILWLVIIVLMNLVKCPGCHKSFSRGVGIRVHQKSCNPLRLGANTIFLKREGAKIPHRDGLAPEELADQRQKIRDEVNFDIEDLPRASSSKTVSI